MRESSEGSQVKLRKFLTLTDIFMLSITGMIGSAWLFSTVGALYYAGPASIFTWIIAGVFFIFMIFGFAELGGLFPFSGSLARYNHYSHGIFSNYLLSWAYFLGAVTTVSVEAIAIVTYASSYIKGLVGSNGIKSNFGKIKDKVKESKEYLDDKLKEYGPVIASYALSLSPYTRSSLSVGLYLEGKLGGRRGIAAKYALTAVGVIATAAAIGFALFGIHALPSHNEHIQYLGSQNGYEGFVPQNTINYNGQTDPTGDLILNNGTTVHDVIWNGQYASTIINNHNQIVQLNNQFVGQTDPVNNQQYVPLQDVYVIKDQVPIEQATINGQPYYVIEANKINPADIAGFYTYDKWVSNFVVAMNTPGTIPAGIPGNSPVYDWANVTGTLVYETHLYQDYIRGFFGGAVLVQPNETIIPYGINTNIPVSAYFSNFVAPPQVYNPSS